MQQRITQRQVISQTMRSNQLANFIIHSGTLGATSATLGNGDSATFTVTTSQVGGQMTKVEYDISVYIDSIATNNEYPFGSAVTPTDWLVYSNKSWSGTDNKNSVFKVYVRNISAGAGKTAILRITTRAITGNSNSAALT